MAIKQTKFIESRKATKQYENNMTYDNYVKMIEADKAYGVYEIYIANFLNLFKRDLVNDTEIRHFNKYISS